MNRILSQFARRGALPTVAAATVGFATTNVAHTVRIEEDVKLDYKDVLIRPRRSTLKSRSQVDLCRQFTFKHAKYTWEGVPFIVANMDTVGTFEMATKLAEFKMLVAVHKHYSVEEWVEFCKTKPDVVPHVAVSAGTSMADFEKLKAILSQTPVKMICLDIANGYSEHFVQCVKRVRAEFPDHIIMAGNVVTNEMTEELIMNGADIVKVGIGPGSVCTTRKQTGCGYPQLSAVLECADAAHGLGGHVIADGGITCPGDAAKAFCAGGDFLMAGGLFAGHDESAGEVVEKDGKKYKMFYGMSSSTAMKKHVGGVANYRSSEGKTVMIPYKGPVAATVLDLLGGIRSTCTYIGAKKIEEAPPRTTFIRVTQQINNIFGTSDLGKK